MSKYSRLGKNAILIFVGNAGVKLIGLLMLPFYTRWLSVSDYGTVDVIIVYASHFWGVVSCSILILYLYFPKINRSSVKMELYGR